MRTLPALLLAALLPLAGHADCLDERSGSSGSTGLPETVVGRERRDVESFVGIRLEHVVCALISLDMQMDRDSGRIGSVYRGYLALTADSVVFVHVRPRRLLPGRRYETVLDMPSGELDNIAVLSGFEGPNVMMDLGMGPAGALIDVPRGGNGDAIVAELRARIDAACETSVFRTATEVRCLGGQ